MTTILSYLTSIKLTLAQYAFAMAAIIIGGLVFALKLQGTSLHKAQVDLLRAKFGASMNQQDARVDADRQAFLDALTEYEESKK